jgi:hypothetical protein
MRTLFIPPLHQDLLCGVNAIAEHLYGFDTATNRRKVYYLHERELLPTFRIGQRIHARKSDLDAHFARKPAYLDGVS